jgi:hypothetical protein
MYYLLFNIAEFCIFPIWCVWYSMYFMWFSEWIDSFTQDLVGLCNGNTLWDRIEFSNTILVKIRHHRSRNIMKLSLLLEAVNSWVLLMDLWGRISSDGVCAGFHLLECNMRWCTLVSAGGEMQDIHIHVTHHNFPARSKYVSCFSCIVCVSSSDKVGALPRNSFFIVNILIHKTKNWQCSISGCEHNAGVNSEKWSKQYKTWIVVHVCRSMEICALSTVCQWWSII